MMGDLQLSIPYKNMHFKPPQKHYSYRIDQRNWTKKCGLTNHLTWNGCLSSYDLTNLRCNYVILFSFLDSKILSSGLVSKDFSDWQTSKIFVLSLVLLSWGSLPSFKNSASKTVYSKVSNRRIVPNKGVAWNLFQICWV